MLYLTYSGVCIMEGQAFAISKMSQNFTRAWRWKLVLYQTTQIEATEQNMGQYKCEGHGKSCFRLEIEEKTTLLRHRHQNVHAKESSPLY